MKKGLKYTLVSLGCLVVLAGVGLGIMYVVSPYKVKRWVGIASSYSDVFVDRLKGQPYTHGGYDGIDVSKHNGVIKWKEIAKNKRIKFFRIIHKKRMKNLVIQNKMSNFADIKSQQHPIGCSWSWSM